MRLIDAEALMKNIDEQLASHDGLDMFDKETVYLIGVNDVVSYIVTATTVDAVEVIRCKDCKWSYWQDETEWTYEGLYCRQYEASMNDDGYCSRGEKMRADDYCYKGEGKTE